MKSKLIVLLFILGWLILIGWNLISERFIPGNFWRDRARVVFCDVGQGDGILIVKDEWQVLIDAGYDDQVLSCLQEEIGPDDKVIELAVVTHSDLDHYGGIKAVFADYQIENMLIDGVVKDSEEWWEFYQILEENVQSGRTKVVLPKVAQKWYFGESLSLEVLWHNEKFSSGEVFSYKNSISMLSALNKKFEQTSEDYNDGSIVLNLEIDNKNILFTGDIGETAELAMLERGLLDDFDGLKIAHHGSNSSSNQLFLEKVQPEISFISVGEENSFGHPSEEVLERLSDLNIPVLRTDLNGKVVVWVENGALMVFSEFSEK